MGAAEDIVNAKIKKPGLSQAGVNQAQAQVEGERKKKEPNEPAKPKMPKPPREPVDSWIKKLAEDIHRWLTGNKGKK